MEEARLNEINTSTFIFQDTPSFIIAGSKAEFIVACFMWNMFM